jgi:hypothetical protein
MRLIKEDISFNDVQTLTEGSGANKKLYIKGPFLQAEKVNRNNRVYPQKIMDAAVARYMQEYIKENRALGELNHPPEPVVNPERAAIMTTSLEKDGCYYIGTAKVLSTPMGKIVENLLSDGVKVGVSSRGLGSLKQAREGFNEVQEDFMLTTAADVVFDPSAQTAFVEGVYESASWIMEAGQFIKLDMDAQRERLMKAKKAELLETKLQMWEGFMRSLTNNK